MSFSIIQLEDLEINYSEKLGSGYIASVYKAKEIVSQKPYAVKIVEWSKITKAEQSTLIREIEIHSKLIHPHIVKLYSSKLKDNKLFIILEYLPKGTLFEKI